MHVGESVTRNKNLNKITIKNKKQGKTWLSAFDRNSFFSLPGQTQGSEKPFELHAFGFPVVNSRIQLVFSKKHLEILLSKIQIKMLKAVFLSTALDKQKK